MNRSDVLVAVKERVPAFEPSELDDVMTAILCTIEEALVEGEEVKLRDFGTFHVTQRAGFAGGIADVPPTLVPRFRASDRIRRRLRKKVRA